MPFAAAWAKGFTKGKGERRGKEGQDTERKERGSVFQKPDSSGAVGHLSGRGRLTASNVLDNKSRKKVLKV